MRVKIKSTLMLLLSAMIWGSSLVAQSKGAEHMPPFAFNAIRSYLAVIVLLPLVIYNKKDKSLSKKKEQSLVQNKKKLFISSLLVGATLTVAIALQQVGIAYTTVGKAGFIGSMGIILIPVWEVIRGKRLHYLVWIGIIAAMGGMYFLCMTDNFSIQYGDAIILLSTVVYAARLLIIDRYSNQVDGVQLSLFQFLVCAVISTICSLLTEDFTWTMLIAAAGAVIYSGVMSSGVGYTLQILGQRYIEPTIANLIMSLESVFSVLAGWLLLDQHLSGRGFLGCGLMFTATMLVLLPNLIKKDENKIELEESDAM